MKKLLNNLALQVALSYAIFGVLWIVLSDRLLASLAKDPSQLTTWQTAKGWLFIGASTLLIYWLLAYGERRQRRVQDGLDLHAAQYHALVEGMHELEIIILDPAGNVLVWNEWATQLNGYTAGEMTGQHFSKIYPDEDRHTGKPQALLAAAAAHGRVEDEGWRQRKDGSRYWANTVITAMHKPNGALSGFAKITRDLTEQRRATMRIQQLNRIYAVLSEVNQAIVRIRNPETLYAEACRIAVELGGFRMAWLGLVDATTGDVKPVAHAGAVDGYLDALQIKIGDSPSGQGPTATAVVTGQHVIVNDIAHDPRMAPWRERALNHGYCASAAFPLVVEGRACGALNLYAADAGIFDEEEIRLCDELALDIAFSLEYNRQEEQRRQAQATVRESEERYRLLVEQSPYAIGVHQDGQLVFVNPAALRLLGAQHASDLIGKPLNAFIHPDNWEAARTRIGRMLQGETGLYPVEDRYVRLDGSIVPVEVSAAPYTHGGRPAVQVIVLDISSRQRAEAALHESERRLQMTISAANVGLWDWNLQTNEVYYSPEWKRQIGYADDELSNRIDEWRIRVHPDDLERALQTVEAFIEAPWPNYNLEFRFRHKDGTYRSILTQASIQLDEAGKPWHMLGSHVDITERNVARVEREQLVLHLERRLLAMTAVHDSAQVLQQLHTPQELAAETVRIIESILDCDFGGVLLLDEAGRHLKPFALSEKHQDTDLPLFAIDDWTTQAPLPGKGITGWVVQTGRSARVDDVRLDPRYFAVRESIRSELCVPMRLEDRVIGVVNVESSKIAAYGEDDQMVLETIANQIAVALHNAQLYAQVLDHAAQLEERVAQRTLELQGATAAAQAADRLKSAFLATMSHELRTPLNSVIGFTGILLQELAGPLNAEQRKQLGMVRDSAHHLLALINDVLDISKIEAGQLEIARAPFDLHSVIEAALRSVTPRAQHKGLALTVTMGPDVGVVVSDRRRVEQILLNLMSNAVKFTDQGEVRVTCSAQGKWIQISVSDTGIGIRPEDMATLFLPFRQLDSGLARRHEGTGLGLSICSNLVRLLGGEISATSVWGAGSTFSFTLPVNAIGDRSENHPGH